jgi:SAM-dependent methyltransferase
VMIAYPEGVWYGSLTPADVPELVASHFKGGKPLSRLAMKDAAAMLGEMRDHRDKYVAMMKARDQAGIVPEELNQLTRGFQESRAVLTALELDVFSAVGHGGTAAQVAAHLDTDPRATEMLMNALAALNLLFKEGDVFHTTPVTARFFSSASPDNAQAAFLHTVNMWERWSMLTECVRAGTDIGREEMDERGEDWTAAFISAMHRNAQERAPHVVRAVGPNGARRLLDLGGGSGAYSIAFARAVPELRAELLDLPSVIPLTRDYLASARLADRITTRCGDLRTDRFGQNYDLILLSAICHMFSADENRDLLARAHAALAPGGRMVIQEFILDADKTSPRSAALFSLNMLVGTKAGASYSEPEYADWLRAAGFKDAQRVRLPGPTGLMIATK